jgi:uncharacterized protein YjbI with pentapeptide repeats
VIDRLRTALERYASGEDRSDAAIEDIWNALEPGATDIPWVDELLYVIKHFNRSSDETGEEQLVALSSDALANWDRRRREPPRWRLRIPSDAHGMRARWLDDVGRERADAVARTLKSGRIQNFAFGTHDGRLDFRGFVDPRGSDEPLEAGSLESVDFSGARFKGLTFMRRGVARSRFDGVSFRFLGFWSSTVTKSSFRGSQLANAVLDGVAIWPRRCMFRGVDFSRADLSYVSPVATVFEDCNFSDARLHRAEFGCDFLRCTFSGHMHEVTFEDPTNGKRPTRLNEVDFSRADFHWVDFRHTDLSTARLPRHDKLLVIPNWSCVLERLAEDAAAMAETARGASLTFVLDYYPEYAVRPGGIGVVDLRDLEEHDPPEDVKQLEEMIGKAQERCVPHARPAGEGPL